MATVYLAEDLRHDRRVALKVLKPELAAVIGAERFLVEIKTTAALQHPHILPLFDSGTADGFLYYVMPFIDGETLRNKLDRETQLGVEEAVRIATEVADALDYAHRHGVIHRDIKPENILLHDSRATVADFGIALAVSAAAGGRMTETGLSLGTPHYMSPEQATADKDLTARSDIYALGSVLYEMLTGTPPHTGASAQQIIMKIVTEEAAPVTSLRKAVPPNVAAAVARSLEKLPADRFDGAKAFAEALTNPSFRAPGVDGTTARAAPRRVGSRAGQLAAAAGVGALLTVGAFQLGGRDGPESAITFPFIVPPGQSLALHSLEDTPFAVAPDGTRIVYVGVDEASGVSRLYVRPLDRLDGAPLQGTEGGFAPFFSPDGEWVAFVTDGGRRLRKISVGGGPVTTLAEDVNSQLGSGSWGDDGNIVYVAEGHELARVGSAGGAPPERLVRASGGEGFQSWPVVLPGSKAVLFTRCNTNCGRVDLAVLDVATRSVDVVVPGAGRGWYAGAGLLIYAAENGAVFAAPFDPNRRRVTGPAVTVLEQVQAGVSFGFRLAISTSGAMMYLPGAAGSAVTVVEVDRFGREKEVVATPGRYQHPRWSPGGDRVALTMAGGSGDQIWVFDVASRTLAQLTRVGTSFRPSWSPDGKRLAFFSIVDGAADLYWIPADNSGPAERVADGEDVTQGGTTFWTRDGAWIVFDGFADALRQDEDVFAVGTGSDRTRKPVVATPSQEETGAVSPNGKWVAYGSDEGGQWQVYVRPFLEEGGRWLVSQGPAGPPLWASDTELVYVDQRTNALTSARLELGATVRVLERTTLFSWASYVSHGQSSPAFDASRDGQRFLALKAPTTGDALTPIVVLHGLGDLERRLKAAGSGQRP